jgi:hypothetical protein
MLELDETTFDASRTGHQRCVEDLVGAFDKHNEMVDICGLKNKFGINQAAKRCLLCQLTVFMLQVAVDVILMQLQGYGGK